MAFTTAGIAKNLYECGQKRTLYEKKSQSILDELIQLRAGSVINYQEELDLICELTNLERDLCQATQSAALDIGSKTVKVCAGPAAGFATKVAAQVAKKQNAGSDQGVFKDLSDSLTKEVTNEATKTACKKTAEYAIDWLGVAGIASLLATPAAAIGLGTVAAASLLIPSVRERACDFVSHAYKGTEAVISETASRIFQGENINQEIINSYFIFNAKKDRLEACEGEREALDSELTTLKMLRSKKIKTLAQLKHEFKKENKTLIDLIKLNEIKKQIEEIEDIIAKDKEALSDLNQQILLRKKKKLYRLVKYLNKPNFFYKFLTRLFAALSAKFKEEKKAQDHEASQKKLLKKNIVKQTTIKENQEEIDTSFDEGDLEEQQLKVDEIQSKISKKRESVNDQFLKIEELTEKIDELTIKILKKSTKLDEYESNYVETLNLVKT